MESLNLPAKDIALTSLCTSTSHSSSCSDLFFSPSWRTLNNTAYPSVSSIPDFLFFKMRSLYVIQAGFEITAILLAKPPDSGITSVHYLFWLVVFFTGTASYLVQYLHYQLLYFITQPFLFSVLFSLRLFALKILHFLKAKKKNATSSFSLPIFFPFSLSHPMSEGPVYH